MIDTITDQELAEMLASLKKLIACPSVKDTPASQAPFGVGIKQGLEQILKICDELGFKTKVDLEGYYGYAEIGKGDEILGVICHVDEVATGEKSQWITNPFELVEKDEILFGRGVQDDKGPTVACLYALKYALDCGLQLKYRVRFIFETDEETLWRGIEKYKEREVNITLGFAPDSSFPVTNAEKGLLQATLIGKGCQDLEVDCQNSLNVVPNEASYIDDAKQLKEISANLDTLGFQFEQIPDGIKVLGKSVHAMMAPKGVNAVVRLAIALSKTYDCPILNFINEKLGEDATGKGVVGAITDEVSGNLSFNLSSLEINPKQTKINVDLRIPVLTSKVEILERLKKAIKPYGLQYKEIDYLAPMYVPEDSQLVRQLMKVYQKQTGDLDAKPLSSGGATLARSMSNCVAFGGMFPDTPDYMHQINEQWSIADMKKTTEIFIEAFKALNSKI